MEQPANNSGKMPGQVSSDTDPNLGPDQVAFLNLLLQHTSDGVVVLDLSGRIRTWNGAAAQIYGWQLEDVLEQSFADLVRYKDDEQWQELLDTSRSESGVVQDMQRHRHKDGSNLQAKLTISLLSNREGYRVGFLLLLQDVTRLTVAEQRIAQSEHLIAERVRKQTEELSQANILLKHQARTDRLQLVRVSQINQQLRQVTDISRQLSGILDIDSLLRKSVELIQHHYNFYQVLIYLVEPGTDSLKLEHGSGEIGQLLAERGHTIPLEATPSLVARAARNQQVIGANDVRASRNFLPNTALSGTRAEIAIPLVSGSTLVGVLDIQDSRPHRFNESDTNILTTLAGHLTITLMNAQLFAEHEVVLQELKSQTRELTQSNDDLEQFAYVASHDLQEPLRAVSTYLKMLSKRHTGKLNSEGNEFVAYAMEGTERMQQLIADLLQFSRVGRQALRKQVVSSHEVLEEAIDRLKAQVDASNASFQVGHLPKVVGDPVKLVSLFQNLLSNAIKYRGEHRPVITISAERQAANWLFSFTDNGIGFDKQYQDRIFLLFQRLHTSEEYEGTGMGLAICKKIVEQHQGHIYAESKSGQGSTFFFTLPAYDG